MKYTNSFVSLFFSEEYQYNKTLNAGKSFLSFASPTSKFYLKFDLYCIDLTH